MKYTYFIALAGLVLLGAIFFISQPEAPTPYTETGAETERQAIIDTSKILSGGPPKDGIPALTNPRFVSAAEAAQFVSETRDGVVVEHDGDVRFYPHSIMVWHEVVNDVVGGKPLVVTFCPLCGSVAVFDAEVEGQVLSFGVSGKLYESNLLMYDRQTDSYWSQLLGQAVVGSYAGTVLTRYPSAVMSFKEAARTYPALRVLSTDTGHRRDYTFYPYGDYDEDETFYFPVSHSDERLPAKEIMYAVSVGNTPVAFVRRDVLKKGSASLETLSGTVTAVADGSEIVVRGPAGEIPGFYAMWFSWVTHHKDGLVWIARP